MTKEKRFEYSGYHVTGDPNEPDHGYHFDNDFAEMLYKTHLSVMNQEKGIIEKVIDLVIKYPDVPHLKNYLTTAYMLQGNREKAVEANEWLVKENPDYLFAHLNQAVSFIEKGLFDKVPEVLGASMEIGALYPERKVFHTTEVLSFNKIAVLYFIETGDSKSAKLRLDIMQDIDAEHPDTKIAAEWFEIFESKTEDDIFGQFIAEIPFQHPEIAQLYEYGMQIDHQIIRALLELPRQSLIQDLELVIKDSIKRSEDFFDFDLAEENSTAPLHALFILIELGSVNSLPVILEMLRQDEEYLDYYFGDMTSELTWESLMKLGKNQIPALTQFFFEPGHYMFARLTVSSTLAQLALHEPERRNEVIEWFNNVFDFFIENGLEEGLVDTDLVGFTVIDAIDFHAIELEHKIKELFDRDLVNEAIPGNYEDVEKLLNDDETLRIQKSELFSIYDRYTNILNTWAGYKDGGNNNSSFNRKTDDDYGWRAPDEKPFVREDVKMGRNDPCVCGSGKKYKKCCGA